jgi:hypothetical protein
VTSDLRLGSHFIYASITFLGDCDAAGIDQSREYLQQDSHEAFCIGFQVRNKRRGEHANQDSKRHHRLVRLQHPPTRSRIHPNSQDLRQPQCPRNRHLRLRAEANPDEQIRRGLKAHLRPRGLRRRALRTAIRLDCAFCEVASDDWHAQYQMVPDW